MNKDYSENRNFVSVNGIMSAFYEEIVCDAETRRSGLEKLLSTVRNAWKILSGARAKALAKVLAAVMSLIGLVGVVGAMELGSISLPAGTLLGLLLILAEYFCIRHKH